MDPAEYYTVNAREHDRETQPENLPDAFFDVRKRFLDLLPGDSVLDAGCGTGRDTAFFDRQGLDVVGVDIADGAIAYADRHREGRYRVMDLRDLTFDDDRFDGVWCASSIFFVPPGEMEEVLGEIRRILRTQGVAYIGFKIGKGIYRKDEWQGDVDQYLVPEDQARSIVDDAGLELIEFTENESKDGKTFGNAFCRCP